MNSNRPLSSPFLESWECPQCSRVCTLAPGLPYPDRCAECWNGDVGMHLLDVERIARDYFRLDDLSSLVTTLATSRAEPPEWLLKELIGMWERTCGDSSSVPQPGSRLATIHDEIQNVSYDLIAKLGRDVWSVYEQYRCYDNYWLKQRLMTAPSAN